MKLCSSIFTYMHINAQLKGERTHTELVPTASFGWETLGFERGKVRDFSLLQHFTFFCISLFSILFELLQCDVIISYL